MPRPTTDVDLMPVIFLAHGAPYFTGDDGEMVGADVLFSAAREVASPAPGEGGSVEQTSPLGLTSLFSELHEWASDLPRPKSVLMLSAHWEARPLTIGATRTVPLIYDFYGFPEPFYRVEYAAPGAPELAQRVKELHQGGEAAGYHKETVARPGMAITTTETDRETYTPTVTLPPYAVILHNDDHNEMDFVVSALLKSVSTLSIEDAVRIMLEAHNAGQAVVVVCPLEQAELYRDRLRTFNLGATIEKA